MKKELFKSSKKRLSNYFLQKIIVNLLFIILGAILVACILTDMQHKTALIKQQRESAQILEDVAATLERNDNDAEALIRIYHTSNQQTLSDLKVLLTSGLFDRMEEADKGERTEMLKDLMMRSGVSYLYIMDESGKVVLAPVLEFNGRQLTELGFLTPDNCALLIEGTSRPDGTILPAEESNRGGDYYFYSECFSYDAKDYYLILGVDKYVLDLQLSSLTDVSEVLSHSSVAHDGFLFAVDSDGTFLYYENEGEDLSGTASADYGLTSEILEDGYSGTQTINGVDYLCLSKSWDDHMVVCAVAKTENIYVHDTDTTIWSILSFVIVMLLCLAYAGFVRNDFVRHHTETKRYHLLKWKGRQILYDHTLGTRILPLMLCGVLVIFCISFYTQTLLEISIAVNSSQRAIDEVSSRYKESQNIRDSVLDYYNYRFLSKAKLISFLLEEDPSLLNEPSDRYYTAYTDDGEKKYLYDSEGNVLRSICFSPGLMKICNENDLNSIYIFDESGRCIATNTETWYYELSLDPENPDYAFRDVLDGKKDTFVQENLEDEQDFMSQSIGAAFHYYTKNDGNGNTIYVSRMEYEDSLDPSYQGPQITAHRSLLGIGLQNELADRILANTDEDYIFSTSCLGDGFFLLFDKTPEHRVLYSRTASNIDKTAEELNFSPNLFQDEYYGFQRINGIDYLLYSVYRENYYVACAIPRDLMFVARLPIALLTSVISFVIILLLSLTISLTSEEEEKLFRAASAGLKHWANARNLRIQLPSGQFQNTEGAFARWDNQRTAWHEKTPEQKLRVLVVGAFMLVLAQLVITLFFSNYYLTASSVIRYILRGGWDRGLNIFALTTCVIVIIMSMFLILIIRILVQLASSVLGAKTVTIAHLLFSVVRYGSALVCLFVCLYLLGLDATNLIASAGILSLVVGLGAQSLIKDILAGIFIVFEGDFRVGDIVTIADFKGTVMDIGLRTSKIIGTDGNIKIINNSEISGVLNMTKQISYAQAHIRIPYGSDLERIEAILETELPKMKERIPEIISGPVLLGVDQLNVSSVILLFEAGCREADLTDLQRALNREILLCFNRNKIEIHIDAMIPGDGVGVSFWE